MADYTFTALPPSVSPLQTRAQVSAAALALLTPLLRFFSPRRALVTLPLASIGTRHDYVSARLEAFARPLWAIGAMLAGDPDSVPPSMLEHWIDGLRTGTDPRSPEFWEYCRDRDQRMVEMCPLGFLLCVAPKQVLWDRLSTREQRNVGAWLGRVNQKEMPDTNWLWFRVFANLALQRCELWDDFDSEKLESDLDRLDVFYRADGWSNDGPEGYTQMDYYSGSFAIQLAQLIYIKVSGNSESDAKIKRRVQAYKARAGEFAVGFLGWWDAQGRGITFGRSLTYRFAMAGFWSALAFSEIELPSPFTPGVVKGLLLRNLRWWTTQTEILTSDGTLTIGYSYPNQFMSENYNSVGSTYWCMLAFIALALPEDHSFWKCAEEPYPVSLQNDLRIVALREPSHITVQSGGHTFLLSSGQMCHYPVRASQSKYGKYAYSSAFGYSVPTGGYNLESIGGDSALALSDDNGESWRTRRVPLDARIETKDGSPVLVSAWEPWNDVKVTTWLIPPVKGYNNWHLRIHHITSQRCLKSSDAAFALKGIRKGDGRDLPEVNRVILGHNMETAVVAEGRYSIFGEALAASTAGVVGVADLMVPKHGNMLNEKRMGQVLDEDANSNLLESRTVLPTLTADHAQNFDAWIITAVFAMPSTVEQWEFKWKDRWERRPKVPAWLTEMISTS